MNTKDKFERLGLLDKKAADKNLAIIKKDVELFKILETARNKWFHKQFQKLMEEV